MSLGDFDTEEKAVQMAEALVREAETTFGYEAPKKLPPEGKEIATRGPPADDTVALQALPGAQHQPV